MLYREIIAVCSQIRTKQINTLCGQNGELLNVKLVVHKLTTGLQVKHTQSHALSRPIVTPAGTEPTDTATLLRHTSLRSCNTLHTDCLHTTLHLCSPQPTHLWRHFTRNKMSPWTSDELLATTPEQSFVTECVSSSDRVRERERERGKYWTRIRRGLYSQGVVRRRGFVIYTLRLST